EVLLVARFVNLIEPPVPSDIADIPTVPKLVFTGADESKPVTIDDASKTFKRFFTLELYDGL
ncbi:hypothetical protein OFC15_31360, partial [Escherichia coli]|nr:hypothetical protein [Escherichia coli]